MTTKFEQIVDAAYTRWQAQPGTAKAAFWESLSPAEHFAVMVSNLHSQVCNGGFMQWCDNGYATADNVAALRRYLRQIHTPAAWAVADLLDKYVEAVVELCGAVGGRATASLSGEQWEELQAALDPLDVAFYKVDAQLLVDADKHLVETYK